MCSTIWFSLGFVMASLAGSSAFAAGDPVTGEKLAKQHCAQCHDVGPGGAFKTYPPSFASIAKYRSEDQIHARIVFPAMHSAMPQVAFYLLPADQIRNIVAYIVSLDK
jgi:mono/diheme cytochrome c family protein